jgi:hypothetical protein
VASVGRNWATGTTAGCGVGGAARAKEGVRRSAASARRRREERRQVIEAILS